MHALSVAQHNISSTYGPAHIEFRTLHKMMYNHLNVNLEILLPYSGNRNDPLMKLNDGVLGLFCAHWLG